MKRQLWTHIRLAWHTGRALRHGELADRMAVKLGMCPDCAGTDGKHQLNCPIWPHNQEKP